MRIIQSERTLASWYVSAKLDRCLLLSCKISNSVHSAREIFYSFSSIILKQSLPESTQVQLQAFELPFCVVFFSFVRKNCTCLLNMPSTRWTRNASTLANPGPRPADLELGKGKGFAVPVQQAKPRNDWRTCCPDKMHRRDTEKHRKPSWHSAPYSTWERACGKPKRSKCPQTAISAASAPSPGATGQGIATRRAFISHPANPSTTDCSRVTEQGNRESRISHSQRLQWLFYSSNRSTDSSNSSLREWCAANIFTRDKSKSSKSFCQRHSNGFCAWAACQTGQRNPIWWNTSTS